MLCKLSGIKAANIAGSSVAGGSVTLETEQMFDYVERGMRNREVYHYHFHVCTNALSVTL